LKIFPLKYGESPCIKDNTHQRLGKYLHPIVSFTAEREISGRKEDISLVKKTSDMIALISTELTKRGCHVIQSTGDADVDIVKRKSQHSRN